MNPPATIRVLHLDFEFRLVDDTFGHAANAYGYCDKIRQVLSVAKNLRPGLMADTALHEVFHAIHLAIGAEEELTEEQFAMQFSGPLCCVIRDNPQFFAWVQSLLSPPNGEIGISP